MAETESNKLPAVGQGPAIPIPADSEEAKKDKGGYTHPNLHRDIDVADAPVIVKDTKNNTDVRETANREYSLGIYGVNSYRTVKYHVHDDGIAVDSKGNTVLTYPDNNEIP